MKWTWTPSEGTFLGRDVSSFIDRSIWPDLSFPPQLRELETDFDRYWQLLTHIDRFWRMIMTCPWWHFKMSSWPDSAFLLSWEKMRKILTDFPSWLILWWSLFESGPDWDERLRTLWPWRVMTQRGWPSLRADSHENAHCSLVLNALTLANPKSLSGRRLRVTLT